MTLIDDNTRLYLEDETIFSAGDDAVEALIIEAGEVRLYKESNGQRDYIATLGVGEIFGEMAIIGNRKHTLSAVATKEVQMVSIAKEVLMKKLESTDPLIKAMVYMYIKRLEEQEKEIDNKTT